MYRYRMFGLSAFLVFLIAAPVFAQEGTVTGRVVAMSSGAPLGEVQVTVEGHRR